MELLFEAIELTIGTIEEMTVFFYQQKNQEGYLSLEVVLNHIEQVLNRITEQNNLSNTNINEELLLQSMNKAMQALKIKDTILLSDIMKYETIAILCEMKEVYN